MCSLALPNTILVTDALRDVLEGRYVLQPRGALDVKGKGPVVAHTLLCSFTTALQMRSESYTEAARLAASQFVAPATSPMTAPGELPDRFTPPHELLSRMAEER
eukprot:TRINITY_DN1616_c0_g1_i1.p1 TRINITY_DN1616_c0_g1~~TRINITY_DN1616_c0_g1_i1.p1  ORF type:complete len:104 (+),score=22.76 TRINITY_DN1616_c0_g1_i1:2-313(+)